MPGGVLGFGSNILQGRQTRAAPTVPGFSGNVGIRTPGFGLQTTRIGESLQTDLQRLGSPEQTAFGQRFPRILGDLDVLRQRAAPTASAFREAGLGALRSARQAATSNLSQSLARRNVLGSSFGQDALSRLGAEFGQQRAQFEADVSLQEIQVQSQLIQQENQILSEALSRQLAELGVAAGLPIQVQQLLNQNAAIRANAILGDEAVALGRNKLTFEVGKSVASAIAASSRQFKNDHGEMSSDELLDAIETLPIHEWEYKRHIGPWAEDFANRFGGDGVVLKLADMNGILLGAVKALIARVKALEAVSNEPTEGIA